MNLGKYLVATTIFHSLPIADRKMSLQTMNRACAGASISCNLSVPVE